MSDEPNKAEAEAYHYAAREAVGVFDDPRALEAAVDELQLSGFDRADISLLASDEAVSQRLGHRYRQVEELEDESRVPQAAYVEHESVVTGEAAAIGVLGYVGVIVGSLAVVASGGTLGAALAAAAAGGAAGGGLGGLLARFIDHRYAHHLEAQVERGGLLLWVTARDDAQEARALDILKRNGGRDVHVHRLDKSWSDEDRALYHRQPDPWLVRG